MNAPIKSDDRQAGAARAYLWCRLIFVVVIGVTLSRGWQTSYGYRIISGLQPHAVVPGRAATPEQKQAEMNGALVLTSAARMTLVGKPVIFFRIPVQAVMGNKGFWVGSGIGHRILVVGNESHTASAYVTLGGVKDGDLVDVAGMVKPMPRAAQAKTMFLVSSTGALILESEQVCVLASEIKIVRD